MADALDSIKSVFAKVAGASPQEIAKDESLWAEVINAFALEPDSTDLASIAYGRAPRVVTEAVVDTFRRDSEKRSGGNLVQGRKEAIRDQLAAYMNCPPDQLAITRNTTEGVNTVLSAWKLQPGGSLL
jgi:selenocysteine lyase/cysteine desulfurase